MLKHLIVHGPRTAAFASSVNPRAISAAPPGAPDIQFITGPMVSIASPIVPYCTTDVVDLICFSLVDYWDLVERLVFWNDAHA